MKNNGLNETQMRILRMFSFAKTKKQSNKICRELANFYANKAEKEIDEMVRQNRKGSKKNIKLADLWK